MDLPAVATLSLNLICMPGRPAATR